MDILIKNKICCLIITYNPDSVLYELLNDIKNQVGKIIIVDNSTEQLTLNKLIQISKLLDVNVVLNNENVGIAKALNQGVKIAKEMGYNWVLTFDQDSKPYSNIIETITNAYNSYPEKSKIGAIGVNAIKKDSEIYYKISNQKKYFEKDYLITAGCLLSIETFNKIGGFREDFFIDNVDLEYSLRLKKNGKVSLITTECGMEHEAGNSKYKKWLGINISSSNHNSFRRYYMARNHVILSKEYFFCFPYFILKLNYFFFLSLFKILFVEDDKGKKIIASLKGLKDGFLYRSKFD